MNHGDVTIEPTRDPAETIRAHANRARLALLALAADRERWAEIVELAVERAETIGVAEYGTRAWEKLPPELRIDQKEELADWLFYIGVEFDRETELGTAEPFRCLPNLATEARAEARCGSCGDPFEFRPSIAVAYPLTGVFCSTECAKSAGARL